MKLKLLAILFLTTGIYNSISAQEKPFRIMVMGVPQQMFVQGIRIEVDLAQAKEKHWITFAPQFYYSKDRDLGILGKSSFDELAGVGVDVFSRHYLSHSLSASGPYVSWGGGYRFLNLNTSDFLWNRFTENGLVYYRRVPANYDVQVHSSNLRGFFGWQFFFNNHLAMDFYLGFGMRYSLHQRPEGSYIKFNRSVFDYGYTGTLFVGGIRFGVGW